MYTLALAISLLFSQSQTLDSRESIAGKTLAAELPAATNRLVTPTETSYEALLATMIAALEGKPLPPETILGLQKVTEKSDNGFKELYATEILIEAGEHISQKAFNRLVLMATGKLTDHPLSDEKRLLAVKVLQTYNRAAKKVQ